MTDPGRTGRVRAVALPAWRRATAGERRVPMALCVLLAIGLQVVVPARFEVSPHLLMPVLEGVILAVLVTVDPGRMVRSTRAIRGVTSALLAALSIANSWSLVLLLHGLITGSAGQDAAALLLATATIWGTNVIVFGIWYWEFDRGGPGARARGLRPDPDLMFPQQSTPDMAPDNWEPQFFDYLYTSFTNATAFSPTDTMPLSRWAKLLFLVQSSISLITAALVLARVTNVMK